MKDRYSQYVTYGEKKMIDDMEKSADTDQELKEGIEWCSKQAEEKGMDYYEFIIMILYKRTGSPNLAKEIGMRQR